MPLACCDHAIDYPGPNGWNRRDPEALGISQAGLRKALKQLQRFGDVGRIHISRWGTEIWSHGDKAATGAVWSVGKSCIALCAARMVQTGLIDSMHDSVPHSNDPERLASTLDVQGKAACFKVGVAAGPE